MRDSQEIAAIYMNDITGGEHADRETVRALNSLGRDGARIMAGNDQQKLHELVRAVNVIEREKVGDTIEERLGREALDKASYVLGYLGALKTVAGGIRALNDDETAMRRINEELDETIIGALSGSEQPLDLRSLLAKIDGIHPCDVELVGEAAGWYVLRTYDLVDLGLISEEQLPDGQPGYTAMQRIS